MRGNIIQCKRGHYYDANVYETCPHCRKDVQGFDDKTVGNDSARGNNGGEFGINTTAGIMHDSYADQRPLPPIKPVTLDQSSNPINPLPPVRPSNPINPLPPKGQWISNDVFMPDDANGEDTTKQLQGGDEKDETVPADWFPVRNPEKVRPGESGASAPEYRYTNNPITGWLVCIKGSNVGKAFPLVTGQNFIGRDSKMNVCLQNDLSVSRSKHGIIAYEPKNRCFYAQPGESHSLFYVNDKVVLNPIELKDRDKIEVGKHILVFVPFCDERFGWDDITE